MKTAVIYARYSCEKQTEQSIEGQLRVCHEYAERNNIVVLNTYIDRAMSGTNDNRKEFQKMLKDSNNKAWDYVLVYKIDRFGRNKYEMAINKKTLKDNGIRLLSAMENIPDTPEGIILESLLEGMAEYYSAELSQKLKRGMYECRKNGNFTGGYLIYGYRVENKKILIDEEQAEVVRKIYNDYASGIYVKDIMEELNEKGITHRGKPFSRTTIYNMLANEKYSGIVKYGDEVYTNIYPKIVPDEIGNIVRHKKIENHYGKHDSNVVYLLKNKVKCGYCGRPISSETGTSRNKTVMRYYKCLGKKLKSKCKKEQIRKDILEKLVVDTTFKIFDNDDCLNKIIQSVLKLHKEKGDDKTVINLLESQKAEIQTSIDNLVRCMEKGIITNSTKTRIEELEHELEEINLKIAKEKSYRRSLITKEDIISFVKTSLKKNPQTMIKYLIKEIVLYDDKIEIYYNYTDSYKKGPDDNEHQGLCIYEDIFGMMIENNTFKHDLYSICFDVKCYV